MATVTVKTNPVNWFEIPVLDLDRAISFYEKVFGYQLTRETMEGFSMAFFPMAENVSGAAGTLMKAEHYTPSSNGTMVYFSVDDIDEVLRRANANGGSTIVPKRGIGKYGFIAHLEDTEGNRIALHSMK